MKNLFLKIRNIIIGNWRNLIGYQSDETKRRRSIQEEYNLLHNITPQTIIKEIADEIRIIDDVSANVYDEITVEDYRKLSKIEQHKLDMKLVRVEYAFDGGKMLLTAQNGSEEVCTYEKKALSETDKAEAILVTKSAQDGPRFL